MSDALRKDPRWKRVVANARAVRGGLAECLTISDQLSNPQLKGEAMRFIHAMEFLAASVLRQRGRIVRTLPPEQEIMARLRDEVAHIGQLLEDNDRIAHELGDTETRQLMFRSVNLLEHFTTMLDRKSA